MSKNKSSKGKEREIVRRFFIWLRILASVNKSAEGRGAHRWRSLPENSADKDKEVS
jgi:hypothetical protein